MISKELRGELCSIKEHVERLVEEYGNVMDDDPETNVAFKANVRAALTEMAAILSPKGVPRG